MMVIYKFMVTVLVIYGIHAATREGMILAFVWRAVLKVLDRLRANPVYWLKPLFDCTPCMASVWGTLAFFAWDLPYGVLGYLAWIFSLSGFNYLVNGLTKRYE